MVMPRSSRRAVVAALKAAHSYEEPAFDVFETASLPSDLGGGRIGVLAEPVKLRDFAALVEKALPRTEHGVRVAGDLERTVERVAVVGGAGDSEFDRVRAAGVDAYVTADLRHHPATEARAYDEGPALVDVAHWASEWPWLRDAERLLKVGLAEQGSTVDTHISTLCTDAWTLRL
jgi:putative NIF3 family GTP cyclohydrolase 1 type 2